MNCLLYDKNHIDKVIIREQDKKENFLGGVNHEEEASEVSKTKRGGGCESPLPGGIYTMVGACNPHRGGAETAQGAWGG